MVENSELADVPQKVEGVVSVVTTDQSPRGTFRLRRYGVGVKPARRWQHRARNGPGLKFPGGGAEKTCYLSTKGRIKDEVRITNLGECARIGCN